MSTPETVKVFSPSGSFLLIVTILSASLVTNTAYMFSVQTHFPVFGGCMEGDEGTHDKILDHNLLLTQNPEKSRERVSGCLDEIFMEQHLHMIKTCTALETLTFPPDA